MSVMNTGETNERVRARRARAQPLTAERIAPGMFEVKNLTSESTHIVDIEEPACQCRDFEYRMGPAGGRCKHILYIEQIADGDLCPACGYETCRPSCPERLSESTETNHER